MGFPFAAYTKRESDVTRNRKKVVKKHYETS